MNSGESLVSDESIVPSSGNRDARKHMRELENNYLYLTRLIEDMEEATGNVAIGRRRARKAIKYALNVIYGCQHAGVVSQMHAAGVDQGPLLPNMVLSDAFDVDDDE